MDHIKLIESKTWYHAFEILPGVTTPGKVPVHASSTLDRYGCPKDLTGKRILDIGAWDGPFSFELERRGAKVVAYDIQDPDHTAFNVARQIKQSNVQYVRGDVYELAPEKVGLFDAVLFLGVFYHLKNPLLAFSRIWSILKPNGWMIIEGAILDHADRVDSYCREHADIIRQMRELPICMFFEGKYCDDWSNWYIPTAKCLESWLKATGFRDIKYGIGEQHSRGWGIAYKDEASDGREHAII